MNEPVRISPEMIRLYDEYTHLTLDRRKFMGQLTKLTGSAAAAAAIVPLLEANQARAAIVPEDDARLKSENITYPGAAGEMKGYLVAPAEAAGKLPAVIVIHENRGLNPHIQDVARRFALEGFQALAPDFLSPSSGKVGAVGFCWGGGVVNQLAVNAPDLAAAVAYYGSVPDPADVPKIKAKLLLHYAGLDERINAGIPAYRKALEVAGISHQIYIYEGANHAFNNDTSEARY